MIRACLVLCFFHLPFLLAQRMSIKNYPTNDKPFVLFTHRRYVEEKQGNDTNDNCTHFVDDEDERDNPEGPLVPCENLPDEFIYCQPLTRPVSGGNETGCTKFGGEKWSEVSWTEVNCHPLPCITCSGPRTFSRRKPCIKYTGHHFVSTFLYSFFMGMFAVDRFCLGYSAIAVGKLMTLGGLGVWWIIDICLLLTGNLMPADNSSWEPFY